LNIEPEPILKFPRKILLRFAQGCYVPPPFEKNSQRSQINNRGKDGALQSVNGRNFCVAEQQR